MTEADLMAPSGQTNVSVHTEGHSLPSKAGARVASRQENAAKSELQKFQITDWIQSFDPKTADLNSILVEIGREAKVKKRHLRPKHVKAPCKRGAQPGNQNALKHGNYTRVRRAFFAEVRAHIRRGREILSEIPLRLVHGGPGRPREHW